jgi:uncharacterized repeat protein (TIGR03803 family)
MRPSRVMVVMVFSLAVLVGVSGAQTPQPDAIHRFSGNERNQVAATFTTLLRFEGTNGAGPTGSLIQGFDGNLYGTADEMGANGYGTVFKLARNGTLTTLYNFCAETNCSDGASPVAGLVHGFDGNFYGITGGGGFSNNGCSFGGCGTVFKITPKGKLTVLHRFSDSTGGNAPQAGLVQATDGNLYGTTSDLGTTNIAGTVFKITPQGALTTLYTFCAQTNCTDGSIPEAALIQATDGNLYGTTVTGGANGNGTVFRISTEGSFSTLYSFCAQPNCVDGIDPQAGLVQATDGDFYGTTYGGGLYGAGTVFRVTSSGHFTTLYSFCAQPNCSDGALPYKESLFQATDGNFYGTTIVGTSSSVNGRECCGTIFKITSGGVLTTLYDFCSETNCSDGEWPYAGVFQATNGNFYGTASFGGGSAVCSGGCGTVFRLEMGLGPFVETVPTSGKIETKVFILGSSLKGATRVTFNGAAAAFTVVSSSEITAVVPSGATTGKVVVTTPGGPLTSNVNFRIIQ